MQRVSFLNTLQKGEQSRTAVPDGPIQRVAVPASGCAPWAGLALCDRGPCSAALHLPQAARGFAALLDTPSTKFGGKSRTRHGFLAHNLPPNFPVGVCAGRRMSAGADNFLLLRNCINRFTFPSPCTIMGLDPRQRGHKRKATGHCHENERIPGCHGGGGQPPGGHPLGLC